MYFSCSFLQSKPPAFEPIDFESYIAKHKTLIQNDPQRELLIYPTDDVSVSIRYLVIISLIEIENNEVFQALILTLTDLSYKPMFSISASSISSKISYNSK